MREYKHFRRTGQGHHSPLIFLVHTFNFDTNNFYNLYDVKIKKSREPIESVKFQIYN